MCIHCFPVSISPTDSPSTLTTFGLPTPSSASHSLNVYLRPVTSHPISFGHVDDCGLVLSTGVLVSSSGPSSAASFLGTVHTTSSTFDIYGWSTSEDYLLKRAASTMSAVFRFELKLPTKFPWNGLLGTTETAAFISKQRPPNTVEQTQPSARRIAVTAGHTGHRCT